MAVDWLRIKTEYINDPDTSYRKLASKYGVHKDSIAHRAKSEDWPTLRQTHTDSLQTAVLQKTVEKISDTESEIAAIKSRIGLQLMRMIENALPTIEPEDTDKLRKAVQSYKDMCEIKTEQNTNPEETVKVIWDV